MKKIAITISIHKLNKSKEHYLFTLFFRKHGKEKVYENYSMFKDMLERSIIPSNLLIYHFIHN